MANVSDFVFASGIPYIINLCWSIILSKLKEAKVEPVFFIVVDIDVIIPSAINISSVVSKPNIVSLFGENKCKGFVFVEDPCSRITEQTVLEENWCLARS